MVNQKDIKMALDIEKGGTMKELILLVYFISLVSLWIVGMAVIDWYLLQDKSLSVIVPISYCITCAVQCYLVANVTTVRRQS